MRPPIDERTKLVIEPPVAGTLRFSSASTLEFLPTATFAPDTDYTVRLESVLVGEQAVKGKVERKLHTPSFAFVRADLASVEAAKKRIVLELVFTGPVLLDDVAAQASLRTDGPVKAKFERTAKNNVVIGATNSNDNSITDFTSFGPTDDGRVRPDVMAPGCQSNDDFGVTSTVSGFATT